MPKTSVSSLIQTHASRLAAEQERLVALYPVPPNSTGDDIPEEVKQVRTIRLFAFIALKIGNAGVGSCTEEDELPTRASRSSLKKEVCGLEAR